MTHNQPSNRKDIDAAIAACFRAKSRIDAHVKDMSRAHKQRAKRLADFMLALDVREEGGLVSDDDFAMPPEVKSIIDDPLGVVQE